MATCDICGYELVIFDRGEFGDEPRYTHGPDTPMKQLDHTPEVYNQDDQM